jgi:hypothetical protein
VFTGGSDYLFNINYFSFSKESQILLGDLNGDGAIDGLDYALMKMYLLGSIDKFPVDNDIKSGDLNNDNVVDALDFSLLRQYLLNL